MKKFINTLIEEFGKEKSKEIFTADIMERLDSLADDYDYTEIFHYTADEVSFDDKNILDFLNSLDINSITDDVLKEVLNYLKIKIEFEREQLPAELIGKLYDSIK